MAEALLRLKLRPVSNVSWLRVLRVPGLYFKLRHTVAAKCGYAVWLRFGGGIGR